MPVIKKKAPIEIHRSKIENILMLIKDFSKKNTQKVLYPVVAVVLILSVSLAAYVFFTKSSEKDFVRFEVIIENYRSDPLNQEIQNKTVIELQKLVSETRFGFVHDMSLYYLGNIFFMENKFSEAYDMFTAFIKKSSSSDVFVPIAVNKSALCLEELGKFDEAIVLMNKYDEKNTDNIMNDQINYNIARLYSLKNNQIKAREYFSIVITRFPKSIYAERSRERLLLLSAVK
jgi:tetratricopeptide (TPR) repeat protein